MRRSRVILVIVIAALAAPGIGVWTLRPMRVKAGLSDGSFTEVESGNLAEGLPVVIGEGMREPEAGQMAERNPFAPPRPPWQQRGGPGQNQGQPEQDHGQSR